MQQGEAVPPPGGIALPFILPLLLPLLLTGRVSSQCSTETKHNNRQQWLEPLGSSTASACTARALSRATEPLTSTVSWLVASVTAPLECHYCHSAKDQQFERKFDSTRGRAGGSEETHRA